ncbi:MAG: helix-turn-helix transcriptional regulator [Kiritimatiellae bacterium]|nr:helix-turn-helix transcriptional regulator [Kiritimatiellia bacterium]
MKNLKLVSDIGKRVREIRKGQGISQDMLAGLAGTGARYISELERGKETARIRELLKLLDALGAGLYVLTPREVAEWKRSTSI